MAEIIVILLVPTAYIAVACVQKRQLKKAKPELSREKTRFQQETAKTRNERRKLSMELQRLRANGTQTTGDESGLPSSDENGNTSNVPTEEGSIPSDEDLYAVGWGRALDPRFGCYYYYTLDGSTAVWENPLAMEAEAELDSSGDGCARGVGEISTSQTGAVEVTRVKKIRPSKLRNWRSKWFVGRKRNNKQSRVKAGTEPGL